MISLFFIFLAFVLQDSSLVTAAGVWCIAEEIYEWRKDRHHE